MTSAEDRLGFYASRFPLVEVDSTYYFLPRREVAKRWVERTPAGFIFDVKAFSLLTQHPTRPEALPPGLRPEGKRRVYLRHLDDQAVDEIWSRFLSALGPLQKARKLGAVLFQFPPWFTIKRANKEYLAECAERAQRLQLCVEFRSPTWLSAADEPQPEAAYLYTKQALESWVPKLEALAGEATTVHAVFRNVHRDFAPRSADRLQGLLEDAG